MSLMPAAAATKVIVRRIGWLCKRTKEYESSGFVAAVFRREIAAFQSALAALGMPLEEIPKAPWRDPRLKPQQDRIEAVVRAEL